MKSVVLLFIVAGHFFGGHGLSMDSWGSPDDFCICKDHQPGDCLPDCENCMGYFYCGNGSIERRTCNSGEIFDANLKACRPGLCPRVDGVCSPVTIPDDPTTPTTPSTHTTPTTPTTTPLPSGGCPNASVQCAFNGQLLPHAEHCRFFWTCVGNCPVLGFCELGTWYNREKYVCDFTQNVKNCPANVD